MPALFANWFSFTVKLSDVRKRSTIELKPPLEAEMVHDQCLLIHLHLDVSIVSAWILVVCLHSDLLPLVLIHGSFAFAAGMLLQHHEHSQSTISCRSAQLNQLERELEAHFCLD